MIRPNGADNNESDVMGDSLSYNIYGYTRLLTGEDAFGGLAEASVSTNRVEYRFSILVLS